MNKKELIALVSEKTGFTKKDCDITLTAFLDVIEETLKSGDKVSLSNFGTFERKIIKGREGVCKIPTAMGKEWKTEDSYGVKFSPSKGLKKSMN